MDSLNLNECQSRLVEDMKEHAYAEIWMCISTVYKMHSFFVSQDILAYSYSLEDFNKMRLRLCVSI